MGFKSASELLDELEGGRAASAEGQSVSGDGTCGVVFVCGRCVTHLEVFRRSVALARRRAPCEEARRTTFESPSRDRTAITSATRRFHGTPFHDRAFSSSPPRRPIVDPSLTPLLPRSLHLLANLAAAPRWTTRCATVCSA